MSHEYWHIQAANAKLFTAKLIDPMNAKFDLVAVTRSRSDHFDDETTEEILVFRQNLEMELGTSPMESKTFIIYELVKLENLTIHLLKEDLMSHEAKQVTLNFYL